MKGLLRRWRARQTDAPQRPVAVLDAAEAYRRWSATYADEINQLQRLEAELRGELLEAPHGLRTLEVGAGTGRVTEELMAAGAEVIAVDLVAEMLRHAREPTVLQGRVCVAAAEALPFPRASFDLVVCALTLGHVADLRSGLGAMVAVLRPGGVLVATDFHPEATRRGWQRSFSSQGETWAVEQHPHSFDTYEHTLADLGCPLERLGERSWAGKTVAFGLRARKAASPVEGSTDRPDDPPRGIG